LKNVSLLGFLSEKQKDSMAYNMVSLKYEDREAIYKCNDDANALYIVTEGSVEVGNGTSKCGFKSGEYFGEEAL
jgi:CRP-like cAMP-binding protein